jgi:hypothetical protein
MAPTELFSIAATYDTPFKAMVDARDLGISAEDCQYESVGAGAHILGPINTSFGIQEKIAAN